MVEAEIDRNDLLENSIDYMKWENDPKAHDKFDEIIKDIPLSNLTPKDAILVEEWLEIRRQLMIRQEMLKNKLRKKKHKEIKLFEKAILFFEFLVSSKCNVSLGKGAIARKLGRSRFGDMKVSDTTQYDMDKKKQERNKLWTKLKRGGL